MDTENPRSRLSETTFSETAFPISVLEPPEGAITEVRGSGSSGLSFEQSRDIHKGGSPTQLIAHFRPQFESQGWNFVEQSPLQNVAALVLTKKEREGRRWNAHLIAIQVGPAVRVFLELHAHEQ